MAKRPVFLPKETGRDFVKVRKIEFKWYPGFATSQTQKSIQSLHDSATKQGIPSVLEISTRSPEPLGVSLSAFNLKLTLPNNLRRCIEVIFQSSKVFKNGGPYVDLIDAKPGDAKRDRRLQESGDLIAFRLLDENWSLYPITAFYDWIYLKALLENRALSEQIIKYGGFTDIAFNPKKSLNCQAKSAALFVSFYKRGILKKALSNKNRYLEILNKSSGVKHKQVSLPGFLA